MKTKDLKVNKIIDNYFKELRHNKKTRLGLGDIRLTLGMQEDICKLLEIYQINDKSFPTDDNIKTAAENWVYKDNGHKYRWSNGSEGGDNVNSFVSGAKWMLAEIIKKINLKIEDTKDSIDMEQL